MSLGFRSLFLRCIHMIFSLLCIYPIAKTVNHALV